MAKHDQRIQKFLQQNADRAPTITDMMTRLNISISEISDSLNSLLGQGLIAKKTNGQGIECWFPASFATSSTSIPPFSESFPFPSGNVAQSIGDFRDGSEARSAEMRAMRGGIPEMQAPIPQAQTSVPKAAPVQVQHIAGLDRVSSQTQSFQAIPQAFHSAKIEGPGVTDTRAFRMDSPTNPEPRSMSNFMTTEPKTGISLLTFAIGLIVAVAISTWFSSRLAANKINTASKAFVDQKTLTDANTVFLDFQTKTKFHIAALEGQVRKLESQVVSTSTPVESLKVASVETSSKKAVVKTKVTKEAVVASKLKSSKKVAAAKATKTSAALTKATPSKIKKKKTPTHSSEKSESAEVSSFDKTYTEPAPAPESAPEVPQPPGLDNQDLPPSPTN